MLWLFSALALALAAAPSLKIQQDISTLTGLDLCFATGLRVMYQIDATQPTVTFTDLIDGGTSADPAGKEGLAHLVEHLWFRSTPSGQTIDQIDEQIGGWSNAHTQLDHTDYIHIAPTKSIATLLSLASARLTNPLQGIDQAAFDTAREVVRSELRQRVENGPQAGRGLVRAQVFPKGHPYHRSMTGSHESLDSLTLDDARAYAAAHYQPANATWVITGPWSSTAFAKLIGRSVPDALMIDPALPDTPLGGATCPQRSVVIPEVPKPEPWSLKVYEAGVEEAQALVGWALPAAYGPDGVHNEMAMAAVELSLGDYYADCSVTPGTRASLGVCRIPLGWAAPDQREATLHDALDQIGFLWNRNYITYQNRVRREVFGQALAGAFWAIETRTAYHPAAAALHHTGSFDYLARRLNAIASEPFDVTTYSEHWFNQRRAASVLLVPREVAGAPGRHAQTAPVAAAAPDDAHITDADVAAATAIPDLSKLSQTTLDNGLRVWVLPTDGPDFVHVGLWMRGGPANAPSPATHLVWHQFMGGMSGVMVQGQKLSQTPELIGGDWFTYFVSTHTEIGIRGLNGSLDALLYLLRKRIDNTSVHMESRHDTLELIDDVLWERLDHPGEWSNILLDQQLGQGSTHLGPDSVSALREVTRAQAMAWNRTLISPRNATLLIIGKVDPAKATALARESFGSWVDKGDASLFSSRQAAAVGARDVVVLDAPRTNARMSLVCPLGLPDGPHDATRELAANAVQGQLWSILRDTQGVTYGVDSWLRGGERAALQLQSDLQLQAAGQATRTTLDTIQRLASGIKPADLQRWKLATARKKVLSQRTYDDLEGWLDWAVLEGADPALIDGYPQRLAAVAPADLKAVLGPCSGHERVVLQGPASTLDKLLTEAEVPHRVMDWRAARDDQMQALAPKRWKRESRGR